MIQFFQLMSLCLNLCLCIDLVLTLWSPFDVAKSRLIYYEIVSIIFSFVLMMMIWFKQDRERYNDAKIVFEPEHTTDRNQWINWFPSKDS
jgi:hypothetical protein